MTGRAGALRRIGLLGGAFDPPHVGHLVAARDALEILGLDEIRLVVTARPPHKAESDVPAELRARMVEASLQGEPGLMTSRIELEREGPSYTVETLRALRSREPGVEWHLLIGADQLVDFHQWREPDVIVGLARLVVMGRAGLDPAEVALGFPHDTLDITRLDVSSSRIRNRIRAGRSVRWLVPGPVLRIIEDAGLYAVGSADMENGTQVC